jgi:hypothetical protein
MYFHRAMNPQIEAAVQLYFQMQKNYQLIGDDGKTVYAIRAWNNTTDAKHYGNLYPKSAMMIMVEPMTVSSLPVRFMPYNFDTDTLKWTPVEVTGEKENERAVVLGIELRPEHIGVKQITVSELEKLVNKRLSAGDSFSAFASSGSDSVKAQK